MRSTRSRASEASVWLGRSRVITQRSSSSSECISVCAAGSSSCTSATGSSFASVIRSDASSLGVARPWLGTFMPG